MENNQNDPALHNSSEALRGDSLNYKGAQQNISAENKNDADAGSDSSQIKQKENEIDPGNEHRHTEDKNTQSPKHDADAGGDATGTAGPKPQ